MSDKATWDYEKLDEDYKVKHVSAYTNDTDGKITGHIVMNVKAWFDENPAEARRLGWIKHIHPPTKDIEYNKQSQYLISSVTPIDEYTVTDEFHIMNKSEEQMRLEELMQGITTWDENTIVFTGGNFV